MKRFYVIVVLMFVLFGTSVADEGMWIPSLIQKLNIHEMQQMGCRLTAKDIYDINSSSLKDAVVALDRGSCTAEIISEDGLLLTNHHCGFDDIQAHSTLEHDYLRDGFWAQNREEELPNPRKSVSFLIRIEDVTDRVLAEVNDQMDYQERNTRIREISGKISNEAVRDTPYDARVRSFFSDNKYYLFVYETFRDVRLVGAPPKSIGKFGGETDNWMWPRQTGDFSIFRVYTGPDGKPADYSKDNIPLHPKYFLPISIKGEKKGDFAMIMGYPGSTNRYMTSMGVKYTMDITNPVRIQVRGAKLAIMEAYMKTSPEARLKYSAKFAGSSNYYKYSIGENKGLKDMNVVAKKEANEKKFTDWVNSDPVRKEKYGKALDLINKGYEDSTAEWARQYISEALLRGPEIFMFSNRMQMIERLLSGSGKGGDRLILAADRIKSMMDSYFKNYDAGTDRKITAALLKLYHDNVSSEYYPSVFNLIDKKYKGDFEKYTEKMFAKSIMVDKARLEAFLAKPDEKKLENDMAYQATKSIYEEYRKIVDETNESRPYLEEGRRLFVAGLMEMNKGKIMYPDANSTMRLTYGKVMDYEPKDGVIDKYFTTLKGYIEKEIPGDDEFEVPAKLKQMYYAHDYGRYADADGTLHTCFLTDNDITGGNSGSPVMNGDGQLIGIAFDGNWEAMSGNLVYEPELQRCICVDIRFVLWTIDKFAGDSHLIDEMKIVM